MHFRHLHLQKWHCKLMWTCLNIKSKCVFCPVCGGGDPLRGISAAAAQFLITLQQTCWSALLRDREHTRHPSAKPAATYTAALRWRYFTKLNRLYFTVGLLDYDKNHNQDYFGQYCNHDYLTRLLVGHITQEKIV